ncbi:MAG: bifunctional proline dehydrogenase/L-glutamate gamma-semialdehyde dehydrogenase PutA [Paracoccaceae bacterium]|nr:bifunctional proline dehydrogenase/L-glutamate gamma-semialdehyde dehydrogenase PutA [Paracoccaceae bacterium]
MTRLDELRNEIRDARYAEAGDVIAALKARASLDADLRQRAGKRAIDLVNRIRSASRPGLMEVFLAEYGLSTDEGVALMCLAEALLRVPDAPTMDALIEDKIAPSEWGRHLGRSSSPLVNASTWALMLTGKVLKQETGEGVANTLRTAVKRLGEPVIRTAVQRAIRELGHQFVLGRDIREALQRARKFEDQGYGFSYDMLGEAALTDDDATAYYDAYASAIWAIADCCKGLDVRSNPGLSVKLSALHPRYESAKHSRVMAELVPTLKRLARMARKADMGFNIDAEESERLELSLDVIAAVLADPELRGWDGFGVVVQAYGKRAGPVIDWLHALAEKHDRRIMVRLVKGAYWDAEIKRAQVLGLPGFPVFTRKAESDASYLYCARKLLDMTDRIYPQFATHNAHTVATILEMAPDPDLFEFQRLQGMGEALHDLVLRENGTRCRIYAPVGAHRDLLAYLVRRLLENGANSSFVNQLLDADIPAEHLAADPIEALDQPAPYIRALCPPADLFQPERRNSRGFDVQDEGDIALIDSARAPFANTLWQAAPLIAGKASALAQHEIHDPATGDLVGHVADASDHDIEVALAVARDWSRVDVGCRTEILERASDLIEDRHGEFTALLCREAGKTIADAISEIREAVDFLRYYAARARALPDLPPQGIFTCISPWNFPLAIFTGQIAAALAAGNGVLAKPAEETALTGHLAVSLLHEAGVPREVLQFLPGEGARVGARLTSDARVNGVCFTGSTETAQLINRAMAENLDPSAPLIAETGGINAMIVDSTALPEQAIRDILVSAFQSAGQRCSALRVLYLQEDIAEPFQTMLFGAMDELKIGNPWEIDTDIGPLVTSEAAAEIGAYIDAAKKGDILLKQLDCPKGGDFLAPAVLRVSGIEQVSKEVFGPVLHIATFGQDELDHVVDAINARGYGLTFAMHSRIDDRVERVTRTIRAGNIYINRNQIGAVVGSQPFGGEGLSGTGPKAGGPHYLPRFQRQAARHLAIAKAPSATFETIQAALDELAPHWGQKLETHDLPGPTGESNRLSLYGRGVVLCLGPTPEAAQKQARIAHENGCISLVVVPGSSDGIDTFLPREWLSRLEGFDLVALWSDADDQCVARQALAMRDGPIIGLSTGDDLAEKCRIERHVCIDTTASGGNASLLAAAAE